MERLPNEIILAILMECATESFETLLMLSSPLTYPRIHSISKANEPRFISTAALHEIPNELLDAALILGNTTAVDLTNGGGRQLEDSTPDKLADYLQSLDETRKRRDFSALKGALKAHNSIRRLAQIFISTGIFAEFDENGYRPFCGVRAFGHEHPHKPSTWFFPLYVWKLEFQLRQDYRFWTRQSTVIDWVEHGFDVDGSSLYLGLARRRRQYADFMRAYRDRIVGMIGTDQSSEVWKVIRGVWEEAVGLRKKFIADGYFDNEPPRVLHENDHEAESLLSLENMTACEAFSWIVSCLLPDKVLRGEQGWQRVVRIVQMSEGFEKTDFVKSWFEDCRHHFMDKFCFFIHCHDVRPFVITEEICRIYNLGQSV